MIYKKGPDWFSALQEKLLVDIQANVSGITQKALDKRMSEGQSGVTLHTVHLDYPKLLEIGFISESSYGGTEQYTSQGTKIGGHDPNYMVYLQFRNLGKVMTPDFKDLPQANQKQQLKDVFDKCDVQVSCNCPAYHWQGSHEDHSKKNINLAIDKYKGTKGAGIWRARHKASGGLSQADSRACKHIHQIVDEVDNMVGDILKKLVPGRVVKKDPPPKKKDEEKKIPEVEKEQVEKEKVRQSVEADDVDPAKAVDAMEAGEELKADEDEDDLHDELDEVDDEDEQLKESLFKSCLYVVN